MVLRDPVHDDVWFSAITFRTSLASEARPTMMHNADD